MTAITVYLSTENFILLVAGMVIYFFSQFKSRKPGQTFYLFVWIKDNWFNVPITIAATVAYIIIRKGQLTALEALALGMVPNQAVDWVQKFIYNAATRRN